jgi:hypothetical protein
MNSSTFVDTIKILRSAFHVIIIWYGTLFACKRIRPVLLLRIRIRILVECRIRIRIKSLGALKGPNLEIVGGKFRIRIRIKLKGRILIRMRAKGRIRIRIKVKIRIRIRIIADLLVSNLSAKVADPDPHRSALILEALDLDSDPL